MVVPFGWLSFANTLKSVYVLDAFLSVCYDGLIQCFTSPNNSLIQSYVKVLSEVSLDFFSAEIAPLVVLSVLCNIRTNAAYLMNMKRREKTSLFSN